MVFWHPKGWALWQVIEQHMRKELNAAGYKEVKTPQIMDKTFWEKSGHWDNYKDNMFVTSSEKREYAVKPMNCPGHVQISITVCARTVICRCVWQSLVLAIVTSRVVHCMD